MTTAALPVTACVVFAPANDSCALAPRDVRSAAEWLTRQGFAARPLTGGVVRVSCAPDLFGRLCACRVTLVDGYYAADRAPTLPAPGDLPLRVAGVYLLTPSHRC